MKKFSAFFFLVVVFAITGWFGIHHAARARLDDSITRFREGLPPGESLTFATAEPRILARGAGFTSLTWRYGDTTVTAARVLLGGLSVRQDQVQHIGKLRADDVHVLSPAGESTIAHLRLAGLNIPPHASGVFSISDLSSLTLESGSVDGVQVVGRALQATLAAKSLALDNYGQGQASGFEASGLDARLDIEPQRHLTLSHIDVRGVQMADQLASYLASGHLLPPRGHSVVELDDFAVDGDAPLLRLARARISEEAVGDKLSSNGTIHGLKLWPMVQTTSLLDQLGYDHFEGDAAFSTVVDTRTAHAHVEPLTIDAPSMGHFELQGDYDNLPLGLGDDATSQIRLVQTTLRYSDNGLVGHFLDGMAKARGVDPVRFRSDLAAALAPAQSDASAPLPTLARFLQAPGKGPLVVTLHPRDPVNILMLGVGLAMIGTPDMAASLGLSIKGP